MSTTISSAYPSGERLPDGSPPASGRARDVKGSVEGGDGGSWRHELSGMFNQNWAESEGVAGTCGKGTVRLSSESVRGGEGYMLDWSKKCGGG